MVLWILFGFLIITCAAAAALYSRMEHAWRYYGLQLLKVQLRPSFKMQLLSAYITISLLAIVIVGFFIQWYWALLGPALMYVLRVTLRRWLPNEAIAYYNDVHHFLDVLHESLIKLEKSDDAKEVGHYIKSLEAAKDALGANRVQLPS